MNSYIKTNDKKSKILYIGTIAIIGITLLVLGIAISVSVGISDIGLGTVLKALVSFDGSKEHLIIRTLRLPRALGTALIGLNLAIAGVLMQSITRNPLASPQIFGINSGASFMVVLSIVLLPNLSPSNLIYFGFLGSIIGGLFVYLMGVGNGNITPVKLALAGMAVHLILSSLTQGLIILNENSTERILFWLAGAVDGIDFSHIGIILPWTILGLSLSLIISKSLNIFSLGEDLAKGLGQKVGFIRLLTGIIVVILAGSSVSITGPIGFIGLMTPHIVKNFVGHDYRLLIPFSGIFGSILLIYSDILSRFISYPFESPVGIVTSIIGAPFFLYLAYKGAKVK